MENKIIQELSEVIQSSNISFLLGAGASTPFLPLLGNIENALNAAKTDIEKEELYKEYLNKVMLPNKKIINDESFTIGTYEETKKSYRDFFAAISNILLRRKSTILSKQVNLFTTNVDVLLETILEEMGIEYNDGFSGRFIPTFSLANFKKTIYQRSLHYEHISEIPVFNVIKLHGSLTWKHDSTGEKILFSHALNHFDETLADKTGIRFKAWYKKILVVNPEEAKHLQSVLNIYYSELLRLYSSELEKENAALFVLGFSMEDKHIKQITLRAAKSNPTLRIFICCSQKCLDKMKEKMEVERNPNIQIFTPGTKTGYFTLEYFTKQVSQQVAPKKLLEEDE